MRQRLGRIQPLQNWAARYSPREGKVNSEWGMKFRWKRGFLRLCRLMCGKPLAFRARFLNQLGLRPDYQRSLQALIRQHSANEIEPFDSYQSNLRCAIDLVHRSSADARLRWIRMRAPRSDPTPRACRKHDHRGRLHARQTLGHLPKHRFRALLVSASLVFLLESKDSFGKRWSEQVNRG